MIAIFDSRSVILDLAWAGRREDCLSGLLR